MTPAQKWFHHGNIHAHSDADLLIVGSIGSADLALPRRELERTLQILADSGAKGQEQYNELSR